MSVSFLYISENDKNVKYQLTNHNIKSGDSVNINSGISMIITDGKNNYQSNNKNRKVEIDITVIEDKLYVLSASYHDKNADGWIDEVYVNLSKNISDEFLSTVVQSLNLSSNRNILINSSSYQNGIIKLLVNETGIVPNTATDLDVISINDSVILSNELILTPCTVSVSDSLAPVVLSASLIDSVKSGAYDNLLIKFSEEALDIGGESCLNFYNKSTLQKFNEELELISVNNNNVEYRIMDSDIEDGDSVNINNNSSLVIKDVVNNLQTASDNIKVKINVTLIEDKLIIEQSAFYDENADGYVDKITITFNQEIEVEILDEIVNSLKFGDIREFEIQSKDNDKRSIVLYVNENSSNILTSTLGETISINDSLKISKELVLVPCEVSVQDSMAPVIIEAHLYDSVITETKGKEVYISKKGDDFLFITCSEDIDSVKGNFPFKFHNDISFNVSLEVISIKDEVVECRVIDRNILKEDDSVSINYNSNNFVNDLLAVVQDNDKNRRCPIQITTIEAQSFVPADIEFILKSTILDYKKSIDVPDDWETEDGKAGNNKGVMVITLEPDDKENFTAHDNIVAILSVYDNLGSVIKSGMEMKFDESSKTSHLLWSGKNTKGRLVGSGGYIVIAEIERYFDSELLPVKSIKGTLGVKCNKD